MSQQREVGRCDIAAEKAALLKGNSSASLPLFDTFKVPTSLHQPQKHFPSRLTCPSPRLITLAKSLSLFDPNSITLIITMADREPPYDPYIPSGGAGQSGGAGGNARTAALQAVSSPSPLLCYERFRFSTSAMGHLAFGQKIWNKPF